MKRALLLIAASAAVYAAAAWWAAARLPADNVAIHVNTAGQVNKYTSYSGAVSMFIGLGGFLLGLAVVVVCVTRFTPVRWLNVPHKNYWTTPERGPIVRRMMVWDMAVIFSMPLVALAFIPIDISLTTTDPEGTSALWFFISIGLLLFGIIGYAIWMTGYRYRPPRHQ